MQARIRDLLAARAAIDAQLADLGHVDGPAPLKRRDPDQPERAFRTCSICRAAGLLEESKGHIAIGHDRWLAQQPGHIQAHFKGQGGPENPEPRLIRAPEAEEPRKGE